MFDDFHPGSRAQQNPLATEGSGTRNSTPRGRSTLSASAVRGFADMHERTIAIRLEAQGCYQLLTGVGAYEADPDLGGILRVAIADKVSPYELFLVEDQWTGSIASGADVGCDFMLSVR